MLRCKLSFSEKRGELHALIVFGCGFFFFSDLKFKIFVEDKFTFFHFIQLKVINCMKSISLWQLIACLCFSSCTSFNNKKPSSSPGVDWETCRDTTFLNTLLQCNVKMAKRKPNQTQLVLLHTILFFILKSLWQHTHFCILHLGTCGSRFWELFPLLHTFKTIEKSSSYGLYCNNNCPGCYWGL